MRTRETPVALVNMPFASALRPSLQLGVLKPQVEGRGFSVRTFDFNLDFSVLIGPERYERLCDFGRQPVGDWLFSGAAFDGGPGRDESLTRSPSAEEAQSMADGLGCSAEELRGARRLVVPKFLDWLMGLVDWNRYLVVGFTTTFQQNCASLALARRIAAAAPRTTIVFGGANVEDEMGGELLRIAPWVDFLVTGEGDEALPELVGAIADGSDPLLVAGVAGRRAGEVFDAGHRPLLTELDALPIPDFDEYFERRRILGLAPDTVVIPFESARGCWWGQKHHCTFCGLNGRSMRFRAKSPGRVEQELAFLAERHGRTAFSAVDNIMSTEYLRTLLPRLSASHAPYQLFYEVKANLREDDVRALADAGVREIQPGIESLSSHVLKLMRKGVSAAQNIALLRSCRRYGVKAYWNILFGFPGETIADCENQVQLITMMHHLEPPGAVDRIWMERFSPIFTDRAAFPTRRREAQSAYRFIYPPGTDLDRIAYFFDYELEDVLGDEEFVPLREATEEWQARWREDERPRLECSDDGERLVITDARTVEAAEEIELEGRTAELYRRLLGPPVSAVALESSGAWIAGALDALRARGLAGCDGARWFALAVPAELEAA